MGILRQASAMIKASTKNTFAYRFNFFTNIIFTYVTLLAFYFIWISIYNYSGQAVIADYTFKQMMTYFVLSSITMSILWTDVDEKVARQVRKGKMTRALLYPMDYIIRQLFGSMGGKTTAIVLQTIPVFILGIILFGIQMKWVSLFYIPIVILSYLINYMLCFIIASTAFWFKDNKGLIWVRHAIMGFLSGAVIPLTFLPLFFQKLSWFLPFQYMSFIPVNTFLGKYAPGFLITVALIQIAWIAGLYIILRLLWNTGVKKYTGAGQ